MTTAPSALTTNRRSTPRGIGPEAPEFAWRLAPGAEVSAAQIAVSTDEGFAAADTWESGWVDGAAPFGFTYAGPPLTSGTTYHWRVRAGDEVSPWSATASFETGILDPAEWGADWITHPPAEGIQKAALYFRSETVLSAPVVRGRAYVSALGWYRLFVNGVDLTGHSLVPRWTPYDRYVEYQTYDVTDAFAAGVNAIGAVVAEGRFRGSLGMSKKGRVYGDELSVIVQIHLDLADGTTVEIHSGEDWTVGRGRIRTSDPKYGERADLRIDDTAWKRAGGNVLYPRPAVRLARHDRRLIAEDVARVTAIEELPGVISAAPSGTVLIDFGQNFAGVARIELPAGAGQTVRILYSEVLTPAGELDTGYLGLGHGGSDKWFQRDEVVLAHDPISYTPAFTIHGFRYVAVEGLTAPLAPDAATGVVLSSDLPGVSTFSASDPRLERLWQNVLWGLRSNFVDTPTDCPTRERSGWTGDIQVFGSTAAQLVDADGFLRRYLRNVAAEQYDDGRVPPIIPTEDSAGRKRNPIRFSSTSVGWGDVTVLLPWTLYRYYGDVEILRRQYDSARAWVDQLARRAATKTSLRRRLTRKAGNLEAYVVDTGYHWGEWLRPGEGFGEVLGNLVTHRPVVASAYFAHSSTVLARIAHLLGREDDAHRYAELGARATAAWRAAFVRDGGSRIGDDKQDDYVRALAFDLLLPEQRSVAAERLVELITAAGDHLGTGFLSTPMLLPALVEAGHEDVAYRVLFQDTAPAWLDQVKNGATTIWENWQGYKENGQAKGSHNHYSFGSVARFLQEHIGGVAPLEPAYRRFLVAPAVRSGLRSAATSIETPYGLARNSWWISDGRVELRVTVPPGTQAIIRVGGEHRELESGEHSLSLALPDSDAAGGRAAPSRRSRTR